MKVIFFEDATSIVGKRKYANKSNSVIGFSLPLSIYSSGLPDQKDSIANNAHDIFAPGVPRVQGLLWLWNYGSTPCGWNYLLFFFGRDNRFNFNDVKNSLNFNSPNCLVFGFVFANTNSISRHNP